jgi:hypothetical protein
MGDYKSVYSQFAMHFSTPEEMEAYKRKIAEERKQQLFAVDLQLFNGEAQEAQPEKPKQATIKPAIKPTDSPIERRKDFSTIRQGTSTNALTKLRATEGKGLTIDQITGDATIKNGNFILTIPKYEQLTGLKTSTYQLLDAITVALTESGAKSPTVILPLEEYMKRRGLKDRKEAKTQAKADMEILRGASFSWEERRGKKTESYSFVNLADSGEIRRNGDIVFTYGTTFYNILLGYPVMPYPAQLQTLNSKRNPNSYYLLRKIAEHKNMNIGKKNEDIIAVKTLLSIAPYIPSYDEVMSGNRNIADRIIGVFERDMDALETTLSWNYCHSLDQPLTDEELNTMSYATFEGLMIHTEWRSYPDQTARLERKAEAIAQAQQKKKRTPSKKKKPAEE